MATRKIKTATPEPESAPEQKPERKTVRDSEIAWAPDETGSEGIEAVVRGFALSVTPVEDKPGRFLWSVKATSEVSETPEVIAADECATEKGGRRWARQTLNRTLRTWQGKGVST
jgi:hypothetical protein